MSNIKSNIYVAIMAGGIGSRFWPASRESRPKQFLDIMGVGKSLIQLTYERFLKLVPKENILVVTNKIYRDLVKEHLPDLTDNQILGEPSRNNTAPCIAYTALKLQNLNPDANLIVAPSDHIILEEDNFLSALGKALNFTEQHDALLTLGIQPNRPDTGYGYIRYEDSGEAVKKVRQFTEKPDLAKAEAFLKSGDYVWNAGIFIWKVRSLLDAFQKYAPKIYEILSKGVDCYNTAEEQAFVDENYPKTPSISIDFAIMEKADNIYTIPSSFGWSDLGTWKSLYIESDKDQNENVVVGDRVVIEDCASNLIRMPKDKLLVMKGLEDYIIIDEGDVLVIYPKSKEQEIKQVTQKIKEKYNSDYA